MEGLKNWEKLVPELTANILSLELNLDTSSWKLVVKMLHLQEVRQDCVCYVFYTFRILPHYVLQNYENWNSVEFISERDMNIKPHIY